MSLRRVDIHALEASLEVDILDSARGRSESTVREWDRYRAQGRQRRNTHVAPVARASIRLRPRPLVRPAGIISSRPR